MVEMRLLTRHSGNRGYIVKEMQNQSVCHLTISEECRKKTEEKEKGKDRNSDEEI